MDIIRESILYKDNEINVCFKNMTQKEQYDCIRLIVSIRTDKVFVCKHDNTNWYIDKLIKELKLQNFLCSE